MADGEIYDFLMTFPCFVVQLEAYGLVGVPLDGECALAVLTDANLAERFAEAVSKVRSGKTSILPIPNGAALCRRLEIAPKPGATLLAIDPDGFQGDKRRYRCHATTIEKALRTLGG